MRSLQTRSIDRIQASCEANRYKNAGNECLRGVDQIRQFEVAGIVNVKGRVQ